MTEQSLPPVYTGPIGPGLPAQTMRRDDPFGGINYDAGMLQGMLPSPGNPGRTENQPFVFVWEKGKPPTRLTYEQFRIQIVSATRQQRARWQRQLAGMGFDLRETNGGYNPADGFEDLMLEAAKSYSDRLYANSLNAKQRNQPVKYLSFEQHLRQTASGAGAGGPSRTVQTMQYDRASAQAVLEDFYADAIGRRPSDKEVDSFQKAINKAAQASPSVSTTTTRGGTTFISQQPGFSEADAQLMARQRAESQVGSAGFRSSTVYYDAFLRAIGQQV